MIESTITLAEYADLGIHRLRLNDPELYRLLEREHRRQEQTLAMIAASSVADPSVSACEGSMLGNVTTEGYPGRRFHAGSDVVDDIELLAIDRAKSAFGARYANVQPHSGSTANQAVMFGLLEPGAVVMGMELTAGGHLTHGSPASVSGRYFRAVAYGIDASGLIDYVEIERLAKAHRPQLIICGASAYPRKIDFVRFRVITDEVDAFLLADISHEVIQQAVFPFFQGTPHLPSIAAKGRALSLVDSSEFRMLAKRIVADAKTLAESLLDAGYHVLTGGTDNHMVLVDICRTFVTQRIHE